MRTDETVPPTKRSVTPLNDASYDFPYPLPPRVIEHLAKILRELKPEATAETGCGASTLVFSQFSAHHTVFAFNEFNVFGNVSESKLAGPAIVEFVEGPTQLTLPRYDFERKLDVVLLDGPHAYPFPDLEYFHFYPVLRTGGVLVIDDLQIPSVFKLFDFARRDAMFELERVVHRTAFLRRTEAPVFPRDGDGWERQGYNARPLLRFTWSEKLRERTPKSVRKALRKILKSLPKPSILP